MTRVSLLFVATLLALFCVATIPCYADTVHDHQSSLGIEVRPNGVTSLIHGSHTEVINYVREGAAIGNLVVKYRLNGGEWIEKDTSQLPHQDLSQKTSCSGEVHKIVCRLENGQEQQLLLTQEFILNKDSLTWQFHFRNDAAVPIEIGDIALPESIDTSGSTYSTRLNMHRLIARDGSFFYWVPADGLGRRLIMTPLSGTSLEYFQGDHVAFIHSKATRQSKQIGTWRHEPTSVILKPGDKMSYGFSFHTAKDYSDVREILYEQGLFDIHVVPGMVVPTDLQATFSLRSKNDLDSESVTAEFPKETHIEYLGEPKEDVHVYRVTFERLGENFLTVNYGNGKQLPLEWFVTLPLETIIKKRASFITRNQQHRDSSKWYDGLFSLWDMQDQVLRGPEDTDGLQLYMVSGSDDPSNSKCVFLAEKNVAHPDPEEIKALEYFVENFVWGKLQRTDEEHPHPYGIYGSENWYLNRNTEWGTTNQSLIEHFREKYKVVEGTGLGKERMWRTFDYTTYIMLYFDLYLIAKQNPEKVHYLDAEGYLERAFGTAKAYFEVPYSLYMPGPPLWSHEGYSDWAYKQGNFHEKYLVELIASLEEEGRQTDADYLRGEWEKKVKYFIYNDPHPYKSEMHFDRTAFESTHAVSRYALENRLKPDQNLWYDKNLDKWYSHPTVDRKSALEFMERQLATNISLRGWLETAYYSLGSARSGRGTHLCYMSQMAGWSILDYALYYSERPAEYLRLGYASILSSWALVNCGSPDSNYGYWYPGKRNDGATGWNFQVEQTGNTWMRKEESRGPWRYDGEIDHGLAGGINAACTVVVDDPLFGLVAYGGILEDKGDHIEVICRDGVRKRFHFVGDEYRFHMTLERDGFSRDLPIRFDDDLEIISFSLENRSGNSHTTEIVMVGLPLGEYSIQVDDKLFAEVRVQNTDRTVITVPIGADSPTTAVRIMLNRFE